MVDSLLCHSAGEGIHYTDRLSMHQALVVLSVTLTRSPCFGNPSRSVFFFSCQGWLTFSLLTHAVSSFLHISLTTGHDLAILTTNLTLTSSVYVHSMNHT